jgi:hypothetical protein
LPSVSGRFFQEKPSADINSRLFLMNKKGLETLQKFKNHSGRLFMPTSISIYKKLLNSSGDPVPLKSFSNDAIIYLFV